jgi:hypothetical protein
MQNLLRGGIKKQRIPSSLYNGFTDSTKKVNDAAGFTNQILLNGISAEQLIESLRPMIREEVRLVFLEQEERLLSPAETCKLFIPAITKATLTAWTDKGWLQEHRIGGRVFYLKSEVLASTLTLGKYKNGYGKALR